MGNESIKMDTVKDSDNLNDKLLPCAPHSRYIFLKDKYKLASLVIFRMLKLYLKSWIIISSESVKLLGMLVSKLKCCWDVYIR